MALLGAAPQFIPYSVLEMVSFVHAVIIGWNTVMSGLWGVISDFLFLPKVPPELVSAAVLGFTLSSTWAFSIIASEWGQHRGFVQNAAYWGRAFLALFDGPIVLMIAFATYPGLVFWIAMLSVCAMLLASMSRLPRFRVGFLTVFGFIATLEGVYLVSTDAVRDTFDSFVCERQSARLPRCGGAEQP